jgi:hypothetical protein
MPVTLTSTGIAFSDSTTQTSRYDAALSKGNLLSVSTYTTAGTAQWFPVVGEITNGNIGWTLVGSGITAPYNNTLVHGAVPNNWTQSMYSRDAGTSVGAQASPIQTDCYIMVGLTNNPGASYTNINYALFFLNNGTVGIYESGTDRGIFGTYVPGDIGKVTYDGTYIRYYAGNGNKPLRMVAVSGLTLRGQVSFYNGGTVHNARFGTLTNSVATRALVRVVGAGGGGAGYCESGGAGGYAEAMIGTANLATSNVTVTVGSGGTNVGYYAAGGNGSASSFGAYVTASGGFGSNQQAAHTGGIGGIGSGGNINLYGGTGTGHTDGAGGGALGQGGNSYFGGGTGIRHDANAAPPAPGAAPGAGGPGGRTDVNWQGGPGSAGAVVVYSFSG